MPPLPSVEGMLGRFPTVFVRLTGRNSVVREYNALVAPASEFCVIPTVDAYQLGYPEVAPSDSRIPLHNSKTFASYTGYARGTAIKMARVDLGTISFADVDFLAYDIMQTIGFDVVLGRSALRETRLGQDFVSGTFRLERLGAAP
jgi:hypothetical protein